MAPGAAAVCLRVLHHHARRIAHGDTVRRNIVDHHAVDANDGALADGHTFHDEDIVPNPGAAPNAHGLDLVLVRRQIGNALHRVARMRVGIHEAHARGDVDVVLQNNLLVHDEDDVVAKVDAIADDQLRFVEQPPAEDVDLAEDVHVVANVDLSVAQDEGQPPHPQSLSHRSAAPAEQRLDKEIAEHPVQPHRRGLPGVVAES